MNKSTLLRKGIKKISLLIWTLTIGGFSSSTVHYHEDSLHCDDYASESMVIDNDGICAVCEFVHVKTSINTRCLKAITVQEDTIFTLYESTTNKQTISFKPERAPPYTA